MASTKRNTKTKPKVYGETNADDTFMPPDRPDVRSGSEDVDGSAEVIDFSGGTVVVDTNRSGGADQDDDDKDVLPLREKPVRQAATDDRRNSRESRDMSKRIQRERNITNRERALREQAEAKLKTEQVARQALEDRVLRVERTQMQVDANADVKTLRSQIEALQPQIVAATEAGNTKEALALQIKLGETQSKLAVLEQDLKYRSINAERVQAEENRRRAAAPIETSQQVHPAQREESIERGRQFKKANRHWWRQRDNQDARDFSVSEDAQILKDIQEGVCEFEPYSEEHFEELATRLHEEFPDLEMCDLEGNAMQFDDDEDQTQGAARRETRVQQNNRSRQNNGRPPQGRNGSIRGNQQANEVEMARRGQVVLTKDDFDTMRTFKMDPNNPDHKKAFAKQRALTIQREALNGEGR